LFAYAYVVIAANAAAPTVVEDIPGAGQKLRHSNRQGKAIRSPASAAGEAIRIVGA